MSVSDAQIIALLQAGKRQGMNALFDRYYKPLVVFADDLLHDLPEAEDTVLEQFVKLWEKELYEHIHPNALSTFLFTIVKNACMNQITKKGLPTEQLDLPHYAIAQEESYLLDETVIETVLAAVGNFLKRHNKLSNLSCVKDTPIKRLRMNWKYPLIP